MANYLQRASDFKQYDLEDLNWDINKDSESSLFIFSNFSKYKEVWKNADVLDIGCGDGWLSDLILKNGAESVEAIEPSLNNYNKVKKLYPHIKSFNVDLMNFSPEKKYDFIISVMVFCHFEDLDKSFKKIYSMLKSGSELWIIVPNWNYARRHRKTKKGLFFEELNDSEYVISVKRDFGIISDIIRKPAIYIKAAEKNGFELVEHLPLFADEDFNPKEGKDGDIAVMDFFRFKKS